MTHLLIFPICLYAVLAATALMQKPRSVTSTILALYTLSAAAATAGYLTLGTTADRQIAEIGAIIVVMASGWTFVALLPLTILALYFQPWVQRHRRPLLILTTIGALLADCAYIWLTLQPDRPLVYRIDDHAWTSWVIALAADSTLWSIVMVFASQIAVWLALGWALHKKRLALRAHIIPLVVVSVFGVMLSFIAPLSGRNWMTFFFGLNYLPAVIVLSFLVMRAARATPLDTLIDSLRQMPGEHLAVLDAHQHVLWHNLHTAPWIDVPPLTPFALPHILTLFHGSELPLALKQMLDQGLSAQEIELKHQDDTYILNICTEPFKHAQVVQANQLIRFQDVTTAQMRRNLLERSRELLTLSTISADITASLDIDQVTERALQHIPEMTPARGAAVYLRDEHHPHDFSLACQWHDADHPLTLPPQFTLDPSAPESPVNRIIELQETVIVSDPDQLQDYARRFQAADIHSIIAIPLATRKNVVGVLLATSFGDHTFDTIEVALLEGIGRQLAVAIDNARLHTREREQRHIAEVLREAASTLANKTLDEALDQLLHLLQKVVDYESATVLLCAEPGTLRIGAFAGFRDDPDPTAVDRVRIAVDEVPNLKRVIRENTPILVADTAEDREWVQRDFRYGSWIGAPLHVHDRVLGCLSLTHRQTSHFTETDLRTASAFAAQVAMVAENTHLLKTEQQRRAHAELMQQASYSLVTSSDLESALQTALSDLARMVQFDQAHIGLISEDGETWTYHVGHPAVLPDTNPGLIKPISHYPLMRQLITQKQPILVPETRDNALWQPGKFKDHDIRCWIGAPLMVRDRIIGVINIDSFQPYMFTPEHMQNVQVFANQIAAALDNFGLVEETRRQNRALSALNTVLAASNEVITHDNLLSVMLDRLLDALHIRAGIIHHYHAAAQELRLRAASGLPDTIYEQLRTLDVELPLSTNISPLVALMQRALPAVTLADGDIYEFISFPLISHGAEIGVLSIAHPKDTAITPDTYTLLTNVGQQLGVVMDNAALFEDTTRRVALSTDLGRLSLTLSTQLDGDAVLDLLCRECISIFDVQGTYIWMIKDDHLVGTVAYGPGADQFPGHRLDLDRVDLLPVSVLTNWRPAYINHVVDTAVLPPEFLKMTGAESVLAIPLMRADVSVGTLLLVDTQNPTAFAQWLLEQIGLLGVQAALAIQNATLFDVVRRRLDQLRLVNETGRYTTAILSPQDLIEGVARKLLNILPYDVVSLVEIEDKTLVVNAVFIDGQMQPPESLAALYTQLDVEHDLIEIARQAIQQAEPVLSHLPFNFEASTLAVPLIAADEVIGVLIVARRSAHSITEEDLDVLEPLAAQLSISVSNARLFEKVRLQAVQLEARVAFRTEQIRQQQERTEAILRSVADAVIVFDLNGQVVLTNPVARDLFDAHDLDMDLGTRVGRLVAQALEGSATPDSSNPNNGNHDANDIIEVGSVILQAKAARVVEADEVLGSVVVLRDISQLHKLDQMKDLFVSTVSHELRTPLANLKLYLSLLERGREDRRANYMIVMDREIERLTRLIDELLQISRLESERHDERPQTRIPVDLEDLIGGVIQQNAMRAEQQHKELLYEYETQPLPSILGDPDQLVRALTNLVGNSINYTPEGGRIIVRSRVTQTPAESVIIEVEDSGIGIPAKDLPTIFERFKRGSNVNTTPGTGLGLAIIKEIVELHQGKIEVESEEGRGSLFRLSLPVQNVS